MPYWGTLARGRDSTDRASRGPYKNDRGPISPSAARANCNLGQYKMEQLSPIPPKATMKARRSQKRAILASLKWGEGWSSCSIYFVQDCNLGQYKMEQLSPIPPKAMMKARRSQKRAILASLKWADGWARCSIYFVQDCRLVSSLLYGIRPMLYIFLSNALPVS